MDGYEAIRLIRRREEAVGKHILIIGLSAHAMSGVRKQALAAGMDDYLVKPIRKDTLRETNSDYKQTVTELECSLTDVFASVQEALKKT